MKEINNKFYMEADIELIDETAELKKEVASVIDLPKHSQKQPDLQYFSAIFVSSGTNLNLAHFLPSELVSAADTVKSKAVDIEHEESEVIGHIYDYAFIDADGNKLSIKELSNMETASLDSADMHIVIAGIIYKNRFPNIAKEVASGDWKVSMEAYYQDYDIKIGNLILDKKEAEVLGFDTEKSGAFGSLVKVIKKGIEIASGEASRVLRGICFSGVGIVKNPANPPSVIIETANKKEQVSAEDTIIVLDYDKIVATVNNVTSANVEGNKHNNKYIIVDPEAKDLEQVELAKDDSPGRCKDDSPGICVNYKRRVIDSTFQDQDSTVSKEDWCTAYDKPCTSFSRDTTDPECLRNSIQTIATACIDSILKEKQDSDKRDQLLNNLLTKVSKAKEVQ